MNIDPKTKKALLASAITVGIDFLWHYTITSPMETANYFGIKFVILFFLFQYFFSKPFTWKRAFNYSVIFWSIFGIYYRLNEVFYNTGWLSRVPDVHLGATTITTATPLLGMLVWYGIHGGAFLMAAYATRDS